MNRRKFITLISLIGVGGMAFLSTMLFKKNRVLNKVHSIIEPVKPTLKNIPANGYSISVETALNSRCTSDYDDDQKRFHWGMFDSMQKLSFDQIENIVTLAKIPRFTDQKVAISAKRNFLTFVIQKHTSEKVTEWAMVESGMQQQAVGLICAALGIGMAFSNLGLDGKSISESELGTIRIKLAPMKPSYDGKYWSERMPSGEAAWLKGALAEPVRAGDKPLISTLSNLQTKNEGTAATDNSISQLMWAARGRTPHLYNSKRWGMTIPTWAGRQHNSSVYLISKGKVFKYINWDAKKPTHSLTEAGTIAAKVYQSLADSVPGSGSLIVVGKNENTGRALWEVGYQTLNLILQAKSLGISYQAALLDETKKAAVVQAGISNPVAVLSL